MIKHKKGKSNLVVDTLSMRYALFFTPKTKFIGFEHIKELYEHDPNFASKYFDCVQKLLKMVTLGTMIICSKRKDYVCLRDL